MSAFYVRKWATFFERFDLDRDGTMTVKDFEALADKLIEQGHLDCARGATLRCQLVEVWDTYFKDIAGGKPLKKQELLEAAKKSWRNEEYINLARSIYTLLFQSIDTNGDGVIQDSEFVVFFSILGIDEDMAKMAFRAIDTNRDGSLSLEEYVAAALEYFTSEDQYSMNRYFWGPLDNSETLQNNI